MTEHEQTPSWAANWYVTRRHVVEPGTTHAICSPYTTLWLEGRTVERHKVPAADTPGVMALKACGLCTRKAKP